MPQVSPRCSLRWTPPPPLPRSQLTAQGATAIRVNDLEELRPVGREVKLVHQGLLQQYQNLGFGAFGGCLAYLGEVQACAG